MGDVVKMLLAVSLIFGLGGAYVAGANVGYDRGYGVALADAEARDRSVVRAMKDVGICVWAAEACSTWTEEDTTAWRERVRLGMTE